MPFRFFSAWSNDNSSKEVISLVCPKKIYGSFSFKLVNKIKLVQGTLKQWIREHFGYCHTGLKELNQSLVHVIPRSHQNKQTNLAGFKVEFPRTLGKIR